MRVFAALIATILLVGCGSEETPTDLTGSVSVDGSSTVFPFALAAAELFREETPDVQIWVRQSDSRQGLERLCAGRLDIATSSRPIGIGEQELCARNDVVYAELPIALDGITVITHPELDVDCLEISQLRRLWERDSSIGSLDELGEDADSGEPLPSRRLALFAPSLGGGTVDWFTQRINGSVGDIRDDHVELEDHAEVVEGAAGDRGGLGFVGFPYHEENSDRLGLVSLEAGDGCVAPTLGSISSGEYPLARDLYLYVAEGALQRPEVDAFVEFMLAESGEIADESRTVKPSGEMIERSRKRLERATGS